MSNRLGLYLRKEPTIDVMAPSKFDVVIYRNRQAKEFIARLMWDQEKPAPSSKTFMLNCFRWEARWLKPRLRAPKA